MVNLINSVSGNVSVTQGTTTQISPLLDLIDQIGLLNGATVRISSNFTAGEDSLGIRGQTGASGSISGINWSYANGTLTFTGEASEAAYEAALREVVFTSTSATGTKAVEISIAKANLNTASGSFYSYVASPGIDFNAARTAAAAQTFLGASGYLATITSAEEQALINTLLSGSAWIGASDEANEGSWRWVTGPENGTQFWLGAVDGAATGYANWATTEPNDANNDEYALVAGPGNPIPLGQWYDEGLGGGFGDFAAQGYLVEYSGFISSLLVDVQVAAPNPVDPNPIDPNPVDPGLPSPQPGSPQFLFNSGVLQTVNTTQTTAATVSLSNFKSKTVIEIGFFKVDDAAGKINGLAPGSQGYLEAALSRAQTVFSTPDGKDFGNLTLNRSLDFSQDGFFSFFVIEEGTIDGLKRGGSGKVTFGNQLKNGRLPLSIDSQSDQFSVKWDLDDNPGTSELVFSFQPSTQGRSLGSGLQGGTESEVLDLRGIQGTAKARAEIRREARYNNEVGFFAVENVQGQVRDEFGNLLSPGDQGYVRAAVRQWGNRSGLTGENNRVVTTSFDLEGGKIWSPFIVSDGTIAQLLDSSASNDPQVFFPYLGANPGGVDHIRLLGDNTFGFEDQVGGGDRDYDDLIVKITVN